MSEKYDKKHWYDGWFYAKFIDPWVIEVREAICDFIEADSCVIDIGSGTGALAFQLAEKCRYVAGIELSSEMVEFASKRKEQGGFLNVDFFHLNAARLSEIAKQRFDCAVISLMLHEISAPDRIAVINEAKHIAEEIVIADLNVPQPWSLRGIWNMAPELLAGADHFKNSVSFILNGGIEQLLDGTVFKIENEVVDRIGKYKVVRVSF